MATYTYTGDPLNVENDRLRLMIGDTGDGSPSSSTCNFSDEENEWWLAEGGGNWHLAAHHALVALAGKYSRLADKTLGPMSIKYGQISENYRNQAKEEFDNATNSANVSPEPYSFTQQTGTRDRSLEDGETLQVPAKFYRDEYENYGDTSTDDDRTHWTD